MRFLVKVTKHLFVCMKDIFAINIPAVIKLPVIEKLSLDYFSSARKIPVCEFQPSNKYFKIFE